MKLRVTLEKRLGYNFRGNDTFLQAFFCECINICSHSVFRFDLMFVWMADEERL